MRKFFAVLAIFAIISTQILAEEEKVSIGDFEKDQQGWEYNGGWEFKGAEGALSIDKENMRSGAASLRIHGDFTKGGSYVAAVKKFKADMKSLSFSIRTTKLKGFDMRLKDRSGQIFQYPMKLESNEEWQTVKIEDFEKAGGSWGGKNDKKFHLPATELWIMNGRQHITDGGKTADIWLDDVEIVREKEIIVPPKPIPSGVKIPQDSIFGFSGHMIHTDLFYGPDKFAPYWRLEYTLPYLLEGGFGCMREPLYQGFFTDEGDKKNENKDRNRKQVEKYLEMYSKSGIRVLLCPMFTRSGRPSFDDFFNWLSELPAKYPAVRGFEMHNEPNLKHFWGWTVEDYAEACKAGTKILKSKNPDVPVVIGSISHLWWGPGVKFLQKAIKAGALEGADGISTHPYRKDFAPEGGDMHCDRFDPNGLETEIMDFWAMIQKYNKDNRELGLYFTEFGYSSGNGKGAFAPEQAQGISSIDLQADYLSRIILVFLDARLKGIPVNGLYWYDLKCDGKDPEDLEPNFGLMEYDTSKVRPGFKAYSEIARTFGHVSDFVKIPANSVFAVNDNMVKRFCWKKLTDGSLYFAFWRLDQLQKEKKDFVADAEISLPDGFEASSVELQDLVDGSLKPIKFETHDGKLKLSLNVRIRASWLVIRSKKVDALKVSGPWLHVLPAVFKVSENAQIRIDGKREIKSGTQPEISVEIDNLKSDKALEFIFAGGGISKMLKAEAGKKMAETIKLAKIAAVSELAVCDYYLRTGDEIIGRGDISFLVQGGDKEAVEDVKPAATCIRITPKIDGSLDDWKDKSPILFPREGVKIRNYKGVQDMSGKFYLGYDKDNFYFAAEMTDDEFSQKESGSKIWSGDSIQMSLAPRLKNEMPDWYEFGLALTSKGPEVWCWLSPDSGKVEKPLDCKVAIKNENGKITYECAIPWSELKEISPDSKYFLFSVMHNDNDAGERRGWIEWASGIGADKNPSLFNTVKFQE